MPFIEKTRHPAGRGGAGEMSHGPPENSGVTYDVVGSIDLDGFGIPGRKLRMRRLEVLPGGVVAWHSHEARPANIYIVSGEITEYRSNSTTPIVHHVGGVAESEGFSHWWRNDSGNTTVLISADILPPEPDSKQSPSPC